MSVEENKALARVWFDEVMNEHNLDAIDRAYAPGYVHRGPDGHEIDRAQARAIAEHLIAAVPDRRAIVEAQIAEGDMVVTRWSSRGTHTGRLFGRDPTGDEIVMKGIVISRISEGRIVEDWEIVQAIGEDTAAGPPTA